jgi:hypothetical protein
MHVRVLGDTHTGTSSIGPCLDPKFGIQTLHSKCPVTL